MQRACAAGCPGEFVQLVQALQQAGQRRWSRAAVAWPCAIRLFQALAVSRSWYGPLQSVTGFPSELEAVLSRPTSLERASLPRNGLLAKGGAPPLQPGEAPPRWKLPRDPALLHAVYGEPADGMLRTVVLGPCTGMLTRRDFPLPLARTKRRPRVRTKFNSVYAGPRTAPLPRSKLNPNAPVFIPAGPKLSGSVTTGEAPRGPLVFEPTGLALSESVIKGVEHGRRGVSRFQCPPMNQRTRTGGC